MPEGSSKAQTPGDPITPEFTGTVQNVKPPPPSGLKESAPTKHPTYFTEENA